MPPKASTQKKKAANEKRAKTIAAKKAAAAAEDSLSEEAETKAPAPSKKRVKPVVAKKVAVEDSDSEEAEVKAPAPSKGRAKAVAAKKTPVEDSDSEEAETKATAPSKKRKLEASATGKAKSAQHVYVVIWQEYGPHEETQTHFCGVYTDIKDANNKIIDLWSEWDMSELHEEGNSDATDEVESDGRMKWKATDQEGEGARAWIEKQTLVGETKAKAKTWGQHRPGGVENDGSGEESGEESD